MMQQQQQQQQQHWCNTRCVIKQKDRQHLENRHVSFPTKVTSLSRTKSQCHIISLPYFAELKHGVRRQKMNANSCLISRKLTTRTPEYLRFRVLIIWLRCFKYWLRYGQRKFKSRARLFRWAHLLGKILHFHNSLVLHSMTELLFY